jgi:hypothetical protein
MQMKELNPGTDCEVECEEIQGLKYFHRLFCMPGEIKQFVMADLLLKVTGLDGFSLKHRGLDHILLLLSGRTGNGKNLLLAGAVVPTEGAEYVAWFLSRVKQHIGDWLNSSEMCIFSDRGLGLLPAVKAQCPKAHHMLCFRHLIPNIKDHCKKQGKPLTKAGVSRCWVLQAAKTIDDFDQKMAELLNVNEHAGECCGWLVCKLYPSLFWFPDTLLLDCVSQPII